MKNLTLLLITLSSFIYGLHAQQITYQGFEGTVNDNWTYTLNPAAYSFVALNDIWSDTTVIGGTADSVNAAAGSRFWSGQDLDNPFIPGALLTPFHFCPSIFQALPPIHCLFNTIRYCSTARIQLVIMLNLTMVVNPTNYTLLNENTNSWQTVNVPVPNGSTFVRLQLYVVQNGNDDWVGFDDIILTSDNVDNVPPVVVQASVTSNNTLQVDLNEMVNITAENTANYTGVPNLSSAVRSLSLDQVTLNCAQPSVNGQ